MNRPLPASDGAQIIVLSLSEQVGDDPCSALREAIAQVPEAKNLTPGSLVMLPERVAAPKLRSVLGRLAGSKEVQRHEPSRATRCSCLLARGFVRIGAGYDEKKTDWAWGWVAEMAPSDPGG